MKKPCFRMTVFVTGDWDHSVNVYSYSQVLQHGSMPLITHEGLVELLETGNPEARRISGYRLLPGVDGPDEMTAVVHKLADLQRSAMEKAAESGMRAEFHVFDVRERARRPSHLMPSLPADPPQLNAAR